MTEQTSVRASRFAPRTGASRLPVTLACTVCKARNYKTTKLPAQVIELKKFCKQCKQHTLHKETK